MEAIQLQYTMEQIREAVKNFRFGDADSGVHYRILKQLLEMYDALVQDAVDMALGKPGRL